MRGTIIRLGALALACAPSAALAANAAATANAVTVRPLSVVKTDDLDFGNLIATAVAGTATVNPNTDTRTVAGGALAAGGTVSAAHFTAAGVQGLIALIQLPGSITLTSGANSMTVNAISSNGPTLRLFPGSATIDVAVGGTLNVAANQAQGAYAGVFTVNIIYF